MRPVWLPHVVLFISERGNPISRFPKSSLRKNAVSLSIAVVAWAVAAGAQERAIDAAKSVITVRVSKTGVFSALGHDHVIVAPIGSGSVNASGRRVEVQVDVPALRVQDPGASEKDREEIRKTMLGPDVLDAARFPKIVFRSTTAEPSSSHGAWTVHGDLTLHGQTRPINFEVRDQDGHYIGSTQLKQTDFGIKPVRVAGGTVKVKDELRVEFDVQLTQ